MMLQSFIYIHLLRALHTELFSVQDFPFWPFLWNLQNMFGREATFCDMVLKSHNKLLRLACKVFWTLKSFPIHT